MTKEELEKENAELILGNKSLSEKLMNTTREKLDLQKENAELQKEMRCECTRCVYSDSPCIRSDYGIENDEDVCPNYENVFAAYTQLKKENAELNETLGKCAKMPVLYCLGAKETIAKAKELLKGWLGDFYNPKAFYQQRAELVEQSEQFLKDSEVEK